MPPGCVCTDIKLNPFDCTSSALIRTLSHPNPTCAHVGWYSPLGLTCKRCPNNAFCVTNHARAFGFAAAASESLPYLITASALHSATALPPSRGYFPVDPEQKLVLHVSGGAVMPSVHPGFYAAHLDKYGRWTNKVSGTALTSPYRNVLAR